MGGIRKGNAPNGVRGLVLTFDRGEEQDWRQPLRDSGESKPVEERQPEPEADE